MHIVMVGPFGMSPRHTMRYRALPLARALVRRGHRVTMLLPPWSNSTEAGTQQVDGDVRIINLRLPARVPFYFNGSLAVSLARAALAQRPDVVHCFKPKAYAGLTHWLLWHLRMVRICRSRLVLDSDDWEGTGGWNDRSAYSPGQRWLFAAQEIWCLAHADAVTVASRALQTLAWSIGGSRVPIHYVPNGINNQTFRECDPECPAQNESATVPSILLYTRFVECSLPRLTALLIKLGEHCPSARLMVVGTGLAGEEMLLKSGLDGTPVGQRTTWRGWVEPAELPAIFAASSVAVYPMDDNLINRAKCPVKLTDLLGAGVVVVADAVGEAREYIESDVSGLLVAPGDDASFVRAVGQVLKDSALRQRLSRGARARMRSRYGWDKLAAEVERAYAA